MAGLLGSEAVFPVEQLAEYAIDGILPRAAVRPEDRKATAEVLRWASSQQVPVFPRGGGTQLALGNVPKEAGLVLDLRKQSRLLDYQPADLTATVEAGITLEQLQQELAAGGKFLRLEAPLAGASTIGGILAANASGPLRYSYRQPRDWLIGVSVVGADGTETKAGGKVVKNVTGYDLNKLYTGSLGTLGVIVEATFKLSPYPSGHGALVARFPGLSPGIAAGAGLLRQLYSPQGVQVVDGQGVQRINANRALLEQPANGEVLALAFFSGRPRAVERQLGDSADLFRESGAVEVTRLDEAEGRSLLKEVCDLGWSQSAQPHLSIKVSVPPGALAAMVNRCFQDSPLALPPGVLADPGFGQVRLFWWTGPDSVRLDDGLALQAILKVREIAREAGGAAVVEFCPLSLKKQIDVWGDQPAGMEIMRRIKQEFDPLGILSPGRFVGKI